MKKYFLVEKSIFDYGLSPQSIVLYNVLCKFANKKGKCFPSRKTICKYSKIINPTTYRKNIDILYKKNIVKKSERYTKCGRQTSNLYCIKRNRTGFKVPKDIFEYDLSVYDICVYIYLCKCADKYMKCYPSQSVIARNCHMSRQKVNECIKELRKKGLIKTYMQKRMYDNGNSVLLYDLCVKRKKDRKKRIKRKNYLLIYRLNFNCMVYLCIQNKVYNCRNQLSFYNYKLDSG